ncbi:segregation and condensation protein A [Patescibacteria group bacterium]
MEYQVTLEQFTGPFDLLLDLVDKKEIPVNEISLSEIADQYLEYLNELDKFPMKDVSMFIVVATTLMLVKSRSLMPSLKLSEEEEIQISDLEQKLKLYKQYREIAEILEKTFGKKIIYLREELLEKRLEYIKPKDLSLPAITSALNNIVLHLPEKQDLPEKKVIKTVTLEQKIDEIIQKLQERVTFCFADLKNNPECEKVDLIVGFLALLELAKRGIITAKQKGMFEEIELEKIPQNVENRM